MASLTSRLRGLILSASELKALSGWPDALVEDYLNLIDNIITLADSVVTLNHSELNQLTWSTAGHTIDTNVNLAGHTLTNIGNITFGGTVDVTGATNLNNILDVDGNATMHGKLEVDGTVDFNSTLKVDNTATIAGAVWCQGSLRADGIVDFNNSVDVAGTLYVDSIGYFAAGLSVVDDISTGNAVTPSQPSTVDVNTLGTGDREADVKLHSNDTETVFSSQIKRNAGINTALEIINKGSGDISLKVNATTEVFKADGTNNLASFGSHSVIGAETVTGFIQITDLAGNVRKLAVVS